MWWDHFIPILRVGLKIEIHEIHEIHRNLRNSVTINRNPPSATKSTSTEQKLIIEIQRTPRNPLTNNKRNPSAVARLGEKAPTAWAATVFLTTVASLKFGFGVLNGTFWATLPNHSITGRGDHFVMGISRFDAPFYQRVSIASYANRWYSQRRNVRPWVRPSVRLSVRHTPVLYQNEES